MGTDGLLLEDGVRVSFTEQVESDHPSFISIIRPTRRLSEEDLPLCIWVFSIPLRPRAPFTPHEHATNPVRFGPLKPTMS